MEDKSNADIPPGLAVRLRERINAEGAIPFHDWMEAALYDERAGYYRRTGRARWGRRGDYRTSPERSRLFARTFARFFTSLYDEAGRPERWTILEAGAGAGHFAEGVLETLRNYYPQVFSAIRYVVDEASADARSVIEKRLAPFNECVEFGSLYDNPAPFETGIVFANELLDAFPVHRVTVRDGRLLELYVSTNSDGEFVLTERNPSTLRIIEYLKRLDVKLTEGQSAEVNLRAVDWIERAARAFNRGHLILVDYGAEAGELFDNALRPKGSLRAFHRHGFVEDLLREPGEYDITTTVDWTTIKRACRESGFEIVSLERQDSFLLRAGLLEELARVSAQASSDADALTLSTTAREMILPGGMSESFQVLVAKK